MRTQLSAEELLKEAFQLIAKNCQNKHSKPWIDKYREFLSQPSIEISDSDLQNNIRKGTAIMYDNLFPGPIIF